MSKSSLPRTALLAALAGAVGLTRQPFLDRNRKSGRRKDTGVTRNPLRTNVFDLPASRDVTYGARRGSGNGFRSGGGSGLRRGLGKRKRVAARSRFGGTKTRTKTKTKKKQLKRTKAKVGKVVRKLAKPRSFTDRLDLINAHIGYTSHRFITADTISARTVTKAVVQGANNQYRTISGIGSYTFLEYPQYNFTPDTTAGTFVVGHGDSLWPYLLAANSYYIYTSQYLAAGGNPGISYAAGVPTISAAQSIGDFGSRIQGLVRTPTTADQGRNTYLQVKSYTDKYILQNISNVACKVRVWHIKKKDQYTPVVGTMVGSTVASAGAPTYRIGTGEFESQLEAAAIMEEWSDNSVYYEPASWPLPLYANSAPSVSSGALTNYAANSGSKDIRYGAVWDQKMSKWKNLKKYFDMKCVKTFTLPVAGKKTLNYKYKTKVWALDNLITQVLNSLADFSVVDACEDHKHLKIVFQVIGEDAVSNDNDMQVDASIGTIAVKNVRDMVCRIVTAQVPAKKFVTNSVWSNNALGFNRQWSHGAPQVTFSNAITVGPEPVERPGHVPVDMYAQRGTGIWVPALSSISNDGAIVTHLT